MNRELLKELGLTDEAINTVMAEYGKAINGIKQENEELKAEYEAANTTLDKLKNNTSSIDELKTKLAEYEQNIRELKELRAQDKTEFILRERLTKEGATDTEYLLYKLQHMDGVDIDPDGNVKELDALIDNLKQQHEGLFKGDTQLNVVGTKLPVGTTKPITADDVKSMTRDEINANWEQIKELNLGGDL